jgi:hypothetical protein
MPKTMTIKPKPSAPSQHRHRAKAIKREPKKVEAVQQTFRPWNDGWDHLRRLWSR